MLGSLTLDCNTCNPSIKCSRIIGNKVQTRIGCVRGQWVSTVFDSFRRFSTVFDSFRQFSIVFDGFQLFSIVFNGLSLHEVNTQGVMWSVIGEVFYLFVYFYLFFIYLFIHFFFSPQTNYWFAWGYWGFVSLPPT